MAPDELLYGIFWGFRLWGFGGFAAGRRRVLRCLEVPEGYLNLKDEMNPNRV